MIHSNGLETLLGTVVFLRSDGKTLMMMRDKTSPDEDFLYGKCVPPGGKMNDGEKPMECAERELYEETGLFSPRAALNYKGKVLFDNAKRRFQGKPAKFNFLVFVYRTNSYVGELDTSKDPIGTPFWVPDRELSSLPLEKGDYFILKMLESEEDINHIIKLSDESLEIIPL